MARVFENRDGSWEKVDKILKDAKAYIDALQELSNRLAKGANDLEGLFLEAYKAAPKVDCLYYDSPISPAASTIALKSYLKKAGWKGIKDIERDAFSIKDFKVEMTQAMTWLTKYKQENNGG